MWPGNQLILFIVANYSQNLFFSIIAQESKPTEIKITTSDKRIVPNNQ
jgi:hypothetical protein